MSLPILICDDSALARKQMARTLPKEWDIELSYATNGIEALEAIKNGKGEVLFLDLNMPVMDGYEVLSHIQQHDLPSLVIVVSGDIQKQAHQKVTALGALDFIEKPTNVDAIEEILHKYGIRDLQPRSTCAQQASEANQSAIDASLHHIEKNTAAEHAIAALPFEESLRDACQEVANVAMGRAADLLSKLLDVFVQLPIPNVNTLEPTEIHMTLKAIEDESQVSALCQGFIGAGIAGEALLIFHDSAFKDMAKLMNLKHPDDEDTEIEVMIDTGNVLIGAFLNGISQQLHMNFNQNHPVVLGRHCSASQLIKENSNKWQRTLAMEINYRIAEHDIQCDLLLLFTEDSIPTLNNKLCYLL